ncbi:MAG: sigma-54-dependent transcriptional regulator [Alphaproteobacteria bacterium]
MSPITIEHFNKAGFIGTSTAINKLLMQAAALMNSSLPLLIMGETGTGKNLLAQIFHRLSFRAAPAFYVLRLGGMKNEDIYNFFIPDRKNHAASVRLANWQQAEGGTLVLNGLDMLDERGQLTLLQGLQEAGLLNTPSARIRLVATANNKLSTMLAEGLFLAELYYRLGGAVLHLPPLRSRQGDILLLLHHLLQQKSPALDFEQDIKISFPGLFNETAQEFFTHYPWPGNIRELINTTQYFLALPLEQYKTAFSDMMANIVHPTNNKDQGEGLGIVVERQLSKFFEQYHDSLPEGRLYDLMIHEIERPLLRLTLAHADYNQLQTARILGINRNTLRKKIKELGIAVEEPED